MGFLEDSYAEAKVFFDGAIKKAGEAIDNQKLRFEIAEVERKIKAEFTSLGKLRYATLMGTENDEETENSIKAEIDELSENLEALKTALDEASGKKVCPGCGKKVDAESKFCSDCGTEL